MFLDSLRSLDGKFPEKLEEDVLRPALVARFRMARLYSKLICSAPSAQLENLSKALDNYTYGEPRSGATLRSVPVLTRAPVPLPGASPSTATTTPRPRLPWRRSWSSAGRWRSCSRSRSTG